MKRKKGLVGIFWIPRERERDSLTGNENLKANLIGLYASLRFKVWWRKKEEDELCCCSMFSWWRWTLIDK